MPLREKTKKKKPSSQKRSERGCTHAHLDRGGFGADVYVLAVKGEGKIPESFRGVGNVVQLCVGWGGCSPSRNGAHKLFVIKPSKSHSVKVSWEKTLKKPFKITKNN